MIFDPNGPPGENWYFLAYFGIVPLEVDEYVLPMIEHVSFAICLKTCFKKCSKTFLGQLSLFDWSDNSPHSRWKLWWTLREYSLDLSHIHEVRSRINLLGHRLDRHLASPLAILGKLLWVDCRPGFRNESKNLGPLVSCFLFTYCLMAVFLREIW